MIGLKNSNELINKIKEEQNKKVEKEVLNDFLTTYYKLYNKYIKDTPRGKEVA